MRKDFTHIANIFSTLKIVTILGAITFLFYWLFWGRILVLETQGVPLSSIVELSYFELLHPDMSRSEIDEKMGQPTRIDVPYVESDGSGEVDYAEIRWIYERQNAQLSYYVEEEDVPGGSVEYIPEKMKLSDFFKRLPGRLFGRQFIEIRSGDEKIMFIRLKKGDEIRKINWYYNN